MKELFDQILESSAFQEIMSMVVAYKIKEAIKINLEDFANYAHAINLAPDEEEDFHQVAELQKALEITYQYFSENSDIELTFESDSEFLKMVQESVEEDGEQERYHDYIARRYKEEAETNVVSLRPPEEKNLSD